MQRGNPSEIILFYIGGCTYEEAKEVDSLNKQGGISVLLGGTFIHNSKTFLASL